MSHLTGPTIAPLTSSQGLPCPLLVSIASPSLRGRPWKNISLTLWLQALSARRHPLWGQVSFLSTLRPCIDFLLPLLNLAFELLQGATVFSKLDLRNAYHLVRIRERDEWKTAFNTPLGHFEYLVMPFGLTNAPAVFQALVNDVLRDFINRCAFVYLDDILIFSKSQAEHEVHVRQIPQRLLENRLFVKDEKCEFYVDTVAFLGYIIARGDLKPDPDKVRVIVEWPRPPNRLQLQRFLGLALH